MKLLNKYYLLLLGSLIYAYAIAKCELIFKEFKVKLNIFFGETKVLWKLTFKQLTLKLNIVNDKTKLLWNFILKQIKSKLSLSGNKILQITKQFINSKVRLTQKISVRAIPERMSLFVKIYSFIRLGNSAKLINYIEYIFQKSYTKLVSQKDKIIKINNLILEKTNTKLSSVKQNIAKINETIKINFNLKIIVKQIVVIIYTAKIYFRDILVCRLAIIDNAKIKIKSFIYEKARLFAGYTQKVFPKKEKFIFGLASPIKLGSSLNLGLSIPRLRFGLKSNSIKVGAIVIFKNITLKIKELITKLKLSLGQLPIIVGIKIKIANIFKNVDISIAGVKFVISKLNTKFIIKALFKNKANKIILNKSLGGLSHKQTMKIWQLPIYIDNNTLKIYQAFSVTQENNNLTIL